LHLPHFVMAATFTLAVGLVMQAALLSIYLAFRDPNVLREIARAWKPSVFAGFMGAFASEFWFLGFAITSAANVRTLALVEVLFAQGVTRFVFKQPTTRRELAGIVLVVVGVALLVWAY
jgi:drug/metabolite transporter (DMT)-like permease